MPSAEMVEKTKDMRQQLTEHGEKVGFHIHKWISEKPEVTMDILYYYTIFGSRLASLKAMSISRLELIGALAGLRLV